MEKFKWENGTQIEPAKVEINGVIYEVTPAQFEGSTPLSASNLNAMQDGIYEEIEETGKLITEMSTYSTQEQIIGTWLGKPLYRKCIYINSFPDNSTAYYKVSDNIDAIIKVYGYAKSGDIIFTINNARPDDPNLSIGTYYNEIAGGLAIITKPDRRAFSGYAIVEYTKTTD